MSFDNDFDINFDFDMDIDIDINSNIIIDKYNDYLNEIYENIKNKLDGEVSFKLLNNNMIYISFKIDHIVNFAILTITFNYIIKDYVLSLILYNIENKKIKKIDKRIISSNIDSIRILNNISTISDYILVDFLLIHFN
jgi:hypothetical protein